MPLLILLGGAAIISWFMARERRVEARVVQLGAVRPPLVYRGERVFSLPQEKWGKVECVTRSGDGYCYGVRFRNGLAVVCRDHELVR